MKSNKVEFSVLDSFVLLEEGAEGESQAETAKWAALPYPILKKNSYITESKVYLLFH